MAYQGKHESEEDFLRRIQKWQQLRVIGVTLFTLLILTVGGVCLCKALADKKSLPVSANQDAVYVLGEKGFEQDGVQYDNGDKEILSEENTLSYIEDTSESTEGIPTATPETFSLMMVGDDLLHKPVSDSGRQSDGTYRYDELFRNVKKDAKAADLAMINQEVILGGEELGVSGYPRFNGRQEVGDAIAKAGFNMVLHATNHSMDKGKEGILRCLSYWDTVKCSGRKGEKKKNITVTGMYDTEKEANKITTFEANEITVAVLNYTYGTNGLPLPYDMPSAVNLMETQKVKKDVKKAKKIADFVIVCPHWGTEYKLEADTYQLTWAKKLADWGVDLIIGTHPHVVEPVKWVKGKNGHQTLVYYSLGNFINSNVSSYTGVSKQYYGGMAKVELVRREDGEVEIDQAKFVPLITHWSVSTGKLTTYKVEDYTKKLWQDNRLRWKDGSFTLENMKEFFNDVVGKKWM